MKVQPREWVPYAELVAAFGVIVSMLLVAYELNNNNAIQQAANDNLLYELQDAIYESASTSESLAHNMFKLRSGEELTPEEWSQYETHLWRHLSLWELAYDRHQEGLLSDSKWAGWSRAEELEVIRFPTGMPREIWNSGRETYGKEFAAYVDELYERRANER